MCAWESMLLGITLGFLPLKSSLKSTIKTTNPGSLNHTFFVDVNCHKLAVLWSRRQAARCRKFCWQFQQIHNQIPQEALKLPTTRSFDRTKLSSLILQTLAVLIFNFSASSINSQSVSTVNGTFQQGSNFGRETADLGIFGGTFQQSCKVL